MRSSWQRGPSNQHQKKPGGRNAPTTNEASTFDKLVTYLSKTHPNYSMSDFTEALYNYRQQQQTLTGIPLGRIEEDVIHILRKKYPQPEAISVSQSRVDESDEQSVAAILWSTFKRYREREEYAMPLRKTATPTKSKEEECPICLEDLHRHKAESFSCQHSFHRHCLEEWFKVERTCPLCRQILLFPDEYPELK